MFVDFYAVLGLSPKATDKEIRRAYRALALATHPDRNPAADATQKFQRIGAAGEALTKRRQQYDAWCRFPQNFADRMADRLVIGAIQLILRRAQANR